MKEVINKFEGDHSFLNGFYEAPIYYNYRDYLCSESAYYAQKTLDGKNREKIEKMTGSQAHTFGRDVKLRDNWTLLRLTEMYNVTWCKFAQNEDLKKLLLETEEKFLINVNDYGDTYYGISEGKGENLRGFILMNIRSRLKLIEKQGYETYYDISNSDFYEMLEEWGVDFEFSSSQYKEDIINKFIEAYGYNELLFMILPAIMEDNEELNGEWDEEVDYISQLSIGEF